MITGTVQAVKVNDWGFVSYKVNSTWFGGDKKAAAQFAVGDMVSFEAFEKAGKDGRTFPTIKLTTLKKAESAPVVAQVGQAPVQQASANVTPKSSFQQKDTYWTDKAAEDKAREPRIVYQAAYERAIQFTDLAIKHGALTALEKAKPVAKLEIIQAFVDEQTDRIMAKAFSAVVPTYTSAEAKAELESDLPEATEEEGQWS